MSNLMYVTLITIFITTAFDFTFRQNLARANLMFGLILVYYSALKYYLCYLNWDYLGYNRSIRLTS